MKLFNSEILIQIVARVGVLLLCFPIHESAHAWMANKLGDPTGKEKGRISLNPFKHLDWMGVLMIICLGFGYAKPVPVDIRNFKKPKLYFALTSLAGPVSNIIMAILSLLICRGLCAIDSRAYVLNIAEVALLYSCIINIGLAIFNMLPIPPLDGSRLVTALLPDKAYVKALKYEKYSMIALFIVIFGLGRFGISPVSMATNWLFDLLLDLFF